MALGATRRAALTALLAAALGLACSPRGEALGFEALDISGADWGRDFALRDAVVLPRLKPKTKSLQVIFVTIDPERDTPELLRAYTRAFDPGFIGLYGDAAITTAATAEQFKVFYRKVPTGSSYTMDHSAISYVFESRGRLRLAVNYEQPAASLASDNGKFLQEARS
jgi:protein SCO1/2